MPTALVTAGTTTIAALFSGTISVAVAAVALVVLGVTGFFAAKLKLAEQAREAEQNAREVAADWRASYEAERDRASDFEHRYQDERAAKHEALTTIENLKLRTDQTLVLEALRDTQTALKTFHGDFLKHIGDDAALFKMLLDGQAEQSTQAAAIAAALEHLAPSG